MKRKRDEKKVEERTDGTSRVWDTKHEFEFSNFVFFSLNYIK